MFLTLMAAVALSGPQQSGPPPRRDPSQPRPEASRPAQGVHFRNCSEARAAGRENIRRGEPGYRPELDRDKDGIACEAR